MLYKERKEANIPFSSWTTRLSLSQDHPSLINLIPFFLNVLFQDYHEDEVTHTHTPIDLDPDSPTSTTSCPLQTVLR